MAIFDRKSRYLKYSSAMAGIDERGREINWLLPARLPQQTILGEHRLKHGQRLDRLSAHYLNDPAGFWRVASANEAMTPDEIVDQPTVKIPTREI